MSNTRPGRTKKGTRNPPTAIAGMLGLPFLTAEQMREVDRLMMEEYGVLLTQMMEHAGRNLGQLARTRFLGGNPQRRRVVVLAGVGGNGGGGLVAARWFHNRNAEVSVFLTAPASQLRDIPRHQLSILERMGTPVKTVKDTCEPNLPAADLIIDAIVGYSLRGQPQGAVAALIRAANSHGAPVLALDLPSGLDATSGVVHDPAIRATATLTLAAPKKGFLTSKAKEHVGELYLGDIGVPPELYTAPSLDLEAGPVFAADDVVRLW